MANATFYNKYFRSIGPQDLLPIGTPVMVGNDTGEVVKAKMVPSSNNSGPICLHTIKFTTRRIENADNIRWKRINPAKIRTCNYSFIKAWL